MQAIATEPLYLDVKLALNSSFSAQVPHSHNLSSTYEGEAESGDTRLTRGELGMFGPGDSVLLTTGAQAARAIVVAGKPLNEPVARHGPFVMNTQEQIRQAIADYQSGRL